MKFCVGHWTELKLTIQDKGMWHLVSSSSTQAVDALISDEPNNISNFCPLLRATLMIYERAVADGGLYMLQLDADGKDYCPLCEVDIHHPQRPPKSIYKRLSESWIDGCTESILRLCRRLKRVPMVN